MGDSQFATLDATAQAELVRKGEVTPFELVDAAIARIEELNPKLNAVVTPMFELAREQAREQGRQRVHPKGAGATGEAPFVGVPFLLKDLLAEYGGVPLREGSAYLRHVPGHDSELVARHKKAGLIVLGKTNTPEFGLLPTTEPALFGPTRNPWDTARTPGGSSGGSAAAVAAGLVPMAHANDGGGSIRIPASCCGLFGLKPTRARNPLGPAYGDIAGGLIVEHAVTRSVRDSAALLDATSGPAAGDPYCAPPPERPFLREVGADPGRLRIAFSTRPLTGIEVHRDCVAAARNAAELCSGLGHEVVEASPEVDGEWMAKRFTEVWIGLLGWTVRDWERRTGRGPTAELFEPGTWRMFEAAQKQTSAQYILALQDLQAIGRAVARHFAEYDVWMMPTLAQPPMPLGYFNHLRENPHQALERIGEYTHFTMICNGTGQPAMSVPLHWNDAGLPVGVHFIGRFGDEATLFRLAGQLEQARPWAARRPPVFA